MAIYLTIKKIQGNVTEQSHAGSIALESAELGARRPMQMPVGDNGSRIKGTAGFNEMHCIKRLDKASPQLFQHYCQGKVIPKLVVDVTDTQGTLLSYTLSDVMLSSHHVAMATSSNPIEDFTLNYRSIEMTVTPRDEANKAQAPVRSGFDLEKAEVL